MRPRWSPRSCDLVRQAILLAVGISQAKALVNGNKRTAFQALDTFLVLNGMAYQGDPLALARWLVQVAERSFELDSATGDFETWLREHVTPIPASAEV